MANSLLDFVMSVVRDPDAAAQYAANPTQAIADANLTDVSSVDVNNLIPVVTESLSMGLPSTGADSIVDGADGNVWASGAATAAFDAFDDHLPVQVTDVIDHDVPVIAQQPDDLAVPSLASADDFEQAAQPVIDDVPLDVPLDSPLAAEAQDWAQTLVDDAPHPEDPGFDVF